MKIKNLTFEDEELHRPLKLLVFAHTPPPHHGQSYMVQLLLEGLKDDPDFRVFHVNARVSDDLADVGGIRPVKVFRLLGYCLRAIWHRLRHGADTLYYIPAPAKRSAIVRDWIVMLLVRPWFRRVIFHWHAFGLGHWATGTTEHPSGQSGPTIDPPQVFGRWRVEKAARWLTRKLLRNADLSIVLTDYNRVDAELLQAKKIAVVPNGIPDPCPDFEERVLPARQARAAFFKECLVLNAEGSIQDQAPEAQSENRKFEIQNLKFEEKRHFKVLFLAHCTREKGLFDTLDAVASANEEFTIQNAPWRIALTVAGSFLNDSERAEFDRRTALPDLRDAVRYAGFVGEEKKAGLLRDSDAVCFPTFYNGETFGLVLLEAIAFGLPVVTTKWRGLPDILPSGYGGIVEPGRPGEIAGQLVGLEKFADYSSLRRRFLAKFELGRHLEALSKMLPGEFTASSSSTGDCVK